MTVAQEVSNRKTVQTGSSIELDITPPLPHQTPYTQINLLHELTAIFLR